MIEVSITELRRNISDYISAASVEDIMVMRGGKPIAKITAPDMKEKRMEAAQSLFGILAEVPVEGDLNETRMIHLEERHGK